MNPNLQAVLDEIGAETKAKLAAYAARPVPHFFPPKPFHIYAKERARRALDDLRARRTPPGFFRYQTDWQLINDAEGWLQQALRGHRFQKGTTAAQTFGSVLLKGGTA